jgi:anaerobic magnesium-protoporphyrin IX monomethyl ester cyclase
MLSILVCHSYYLRLDHKQLARAKPYPPLATLQVVSLLRKAGHSVTFFDAMLADGIEDYQELVQATRPQLVLFYEDTYNFLSKMCLGAMRNAACAMIATARRLGARVIAAGPDVTDAPEHYLRAGAEFVLAGEGLSALMELLPRLNHAPRGPGLELTQGLSGIATPDAGATHTDKWARARRPAPVADVDRAAWEMVDIERYRSTWMAAHGYFSLNMAASRGCSFRCAWCAKPTWGNHYVQRDPTEVAAELKFLKESYKPDHIWFADDIFGFRVDWVDQFAAAVQASAAAVPFSIQTRADLISERMARALSMAGCREAWIGAESGSQRILDAMNKGTTVREILTARQRFAAVGVRVGFFIQLGYLGEELADILQTRALLESARPDEIGVSVSYPLPGTRFHELVREQLGRKTNWEQSNDLEMMFHGTYTSDFYRTVRNLLHDQVALSAVGASGAEPLHGARVALERRWQELVASEPQFRSPLPLAEESGPRTCGAAG